MWTKFGLKLQKNFEIRTSRSQGGGGGGVVSDFGRGGRGVKKDQIFADVLYGWPLFPASKNIVPIKSYAIQYLGHFPTNIHLYT